MKSLLESILSKNVKVHTSLDDLAPVQTPAWISPKVFELDHYQEKLLKQIFERIESEGLDRLPESLRIIYDVVATFYKYLNGFNPRKGFARMLAVPGKMLSCQMDISAIETHYAIDLWITTKDRVTIYAIMDELTGIPFMNRFPVVKNVPQKRLTPNGWIGTLRYITDFKYM